MTQGADTKPWWDVANLCRWVYLVPRCITRTYPFLPSLKYLWLRALIPGPDEMLKICADGYFSYRKILHASSHSTPYFLLIKVVKWSSKSSYLLVKITKLCVKWILFIYKNKMRHPPFPLHRVTNFTIIVKIFENLTRAGYILKSLSHCSPRAHVSKDLN